MLYEGITLRSQRRTPQMALSSRTARWLLSAGLVLLSMTFTWAGAQVEMDPEGEVQVGEAHHTEADLAAAPARLRDLGKGVLVHLDHVVEKANRQVRGRIEALPVDLTAANQGVETDRAQVAALVSYNFV